MRRWFVILFLAGLAQLASAADDWMDVATVSATLGNTAGRVCLGASRTDIGCPAYAPYVGVDGSISATRFVGDGSGLFNIAGVSADRIVSGTTSMLAISDTGYISVTQSGVNTAYFHPSLGLVTVGVSSTGPISGTMGYFSGNIGIGTTTPTAAVHAEASINDAFEVFRMKNSSAGNKAHSIFRFFNNLGGTGAGFYFNSSTRATDIGYNGFGFYNDMGSIQFRSKVGDIRWDTGMSPVVTNMIIKNNGLVGIGTISPVTELEVSGTVSATMARLSSDPSVACGPGKYGTIKVENGRIYLCRQ